MFNTIKKIQRQLRFKFDTISIKRKKSSEDYPKTADGYIIFDLPSEHSIKNRIDALSPFINNSHNGVISVFKIIASIVLAVNSGTAITVLNTLGIKHIEKIAYFLYSAVTSLFIYIYAAVFMGALFYRVTRTVGDSKFDYSSTIKEYRMLFFWFIFLSCSSFSISLALFMFGIENLKII